MADHDHDDDEPLDEHTDEEHEAHGEIIERIINEALEKCVRARVCKLVMIRELIDTLMGVAASVDTPLSEIVATVIEEYIALAEARATRRAHAH